MDTRPRVLIADDYDDLVEHLAGFLQDELDVVAVTAADGEQAVRQAEAHQPMVALLDFDMPGMNGAEVAELIRGRSLAKVVILVTGNRTLTDAQRGLFDAVLLKPVALESIVAVVKEALQ